MSNTILEHWKMYFDGSLKLGGAGAGVLFISPDGKQLEYVLQILWQATNNEAEYEALIHGLRVAITLGIKRRIRRFGSSHQPSQQRLGLHQRKYGCLLR